jgi:hypothetical protein
MDRIFGSASKGYGIASKYIYESDSDDEDMAAAGSAAHSQPGTPGLATPSGSRPSTPHSGAASEDDDEKDDDDENDDTVAVDDDEKESDDKEAAEKAAHKLRMESQRTQSSDDKTLKDIIEEEVNTGLNAALDVSIDVHDDEDDDDDDSGIVSQMMQGLGLRSPPKAAAKEAAEKAAKEAEKEATEKEAAEKAAKDAAEKDAAEKEAAAKGVAKSKIHADWINRSGIQLERQLMHITAQKGENLDEQIKKYMASEALVTSYTQRKNEEKEAGIPHRWSDIAKYKDSVLEVLQDDKAKLLAMYPAPVAATAEQSSGSLKDIIARELSTQNIPPLVGGDEAEDVTVKKAELLANWQNNADLQTTMTRMKSAIANGDEAQDIIAEYIGSDRLRHSYDVLVDEEKKANIPSTHGGYENFQKNVLQKLLNKEAEYKARSLAPPKQLQAAAAAAAPPKSKLLQLDDDEPDKPDKPDEPDAATHKLTVMDAARLESNEAMKKAGSTSETRVPLLQKFILAMSESADNDGNVPGFYFRGNGSIVPHNVKLPLKDALAKALAPLKKLNPGVATTVEKQLREKSKMAKK